MKCLFEDYENQPKELSEIIDSAELENGCNYDQLNTLLKRVESIGYTFDYGLDSEPYGLRLIGVSINEIEGFEDSEVNNISPNL